MKVFFWEISPDRKNKQQKPKGILTRLFQEKVRVQAQSEQTTHTFLKTKLVDEPLLPVLSCLARKVGTQSLLELRTLTWFEYLLLGIPILALTASVKVKDRSSLYKACGMVNPVIVDDAWYRLVAID